MKSRATTGVLPAPREDPPIYAALVTEWDARWAALVSDGRVGRCRRTHVLRRRPELVAVR